MIDKGSFRDPAGFVFIDEGKIFRQINICARADYEKLMSSGLYENLVKKGLLIEHKEVKHHGFSGGYKVIEPRKVDFISYPYEWAFSQLKDAAIATLEIQKTALQHGMTLKDASAFNIQFIGSKPVLIDTLSFTIQQEGAPWVAYRQFCQHFLAPLSLMSYRDVRLQQLLKAYIDGLPLDLASRLLPFSSHFNLPVLMHVILHAKSQSHYADKTIETEKAWGKMSQNALYGLVDSLAGGIHSLTLKREKSQWGEYYNATNYSDKASAHKKEIVKEYLQIAGTTALWDLGANTGVYSRIATDMNISTIAFDCDFNAVEQNYLNARKQKNRYLLPLLLDLNNPSPAIGWQNHERKSLLERGPVDTAMALALIHHLAIANNVPLSAIAQLFASLCSKLIIEFVPKSDSQVKRLLRSREDIFNLYTEESFEHEFSRMFKIVGKKPVNDSERTIYLMEKHGNA
ncbi:MAG: nodulation protein NoeA [Candidatus Rifleibacteriota bacterium]